MRELLPPSTPSLQWASAQRFHSISVFNSPWQLLSIWISLLFREMWKSGIPKFLWQWDLQLNYTLCKVCASFWRRNSYPGLHLLGTAEPSFPPAAHARSRSRGVAAPAAKLCASAAALLSSALCSMCRSCFVGQLQVQLGLLSAQQCQVTFHLWAPWTFMCQSPVADETVVIFRQNKPLNNDPESLSKVVQQCSWKLEVLWRMHT